MRTRRSGPGAGDLRARDSIGVRLEALLEAERRGLRGRGVVREKLTANVGPGGRCNRTGEETEVGLVGKRGSVAIEHLRDAGQFIRTPDPFGGSGCLVDLPSARDALNRAYRVGDFPQRYRLRDDVRSRGTN